MSPRSIWATLPLACVLAACSGPAPTGTDRPDLELADLDTRIDPSAVNGHIYGSFRVGAGGGGGTVIASGLANFPGHPPAGPGTCVDGLWYNPQNKPTSGTAARPHPHCIEPTAAIEVVLEPISVCYGAFERATCGKVATKDGVTTTLVFARTGEAVIGFTSKNLLLPSHTQSKGSLVAYAIDASTLGTTNRRVGTLAIELSQYASSETNLIDTDGQDGCVLDATILAPCLNRVITAVYNPLPAPDGLGPSDLRVEGFLWITPASEPYNY